MSVSTPAPPKTGTTARAGTGAAPGLVGRFTARNTPARLRLLLAVTIAASLLWGAVAAWTASQRTSAAANVVAGTEPLSFDAQQIYQSLSDADATEAAAFLALTEPAAARSQYLADIARAETYLEAATAAAGSQGPGSELTVLSTEIPVYTGLVETARADNLQGLAVGAAFLGEASYLMRTALLPAANRLYQQENARLGVADQQATGLPRPRAARERGPPRPPARPPRPGMPRTSGYAAWTTAATTTRRSGWRSARGRAAAPAPGSSGCRPS